jgi:DNA adenine methylase
MRGIEMNKNELLALLSRAGVETKYKRSTLSPLRYAGGKSLAVGYIVEKLPENVTKICSPFMGGGSVELALAKHLNLEVKAYDVFDLLINFWQIALEKPNELAAELSLLEANKETFALVKKLLNDHFKNTNLIDNPIKLAAYYFFNHNTSYGPGFLGWPSSVYMDSKKWKSMINRIANLSAPSLSVEQASFEDSIKANPDALIYADPPYYLDGNSKMFKGIYPQRNFPIHHNGFDHQKLRDLLLNHPGGFILSYNDCDVIRDWYSDCEMSEPVWQYTMGQGETRIGANRVAESSSHVKKSHELLIWKLPK